MGVTRNLTRDLVRGLTRGLTDDFFSPGFSLTAPDLAFASASDPDSDNTQDFNATFFEDITGKTIRLVGTLGSATVGAFDVDQSNAIDATEAGNLLAAFTTGALINGLVAFKCRIEDGSGNALSNWSNTVTKTIAAALPVLSSAVDTKTGSTTASGTVTTDVSGGTLYAVITTSSTTPTGAQIKAGQDHTGAAGLSPKSQVVSVTGVQTISGGFTGLTASTAYFAHYVQENINGFSNRISGDGFTTDAATSAEVSQFFARATGMDGTHQSAFIALIDGLVADGVWTLLDCLYILATDTEAHAKMNLISSSYTITETGTVTWAADVGYSGAPTDTTNTLSTGFNPSTAGGQYTQNSAHLSIWQNTAAVDSRFTMGGRITTEASIDGRNSDGNAYFRINSAAFAGVSVSNASAAGHYIGSRTSSSNIKGYKNGSQIVTGSDTSAALINGNIVICGTNANGTPTMTDVQASAASIGGSLDATKSLALYNRLATYRTAVGL